MTLIRSVAGVRGIVPRDLDATIARRYARAFGDIVGGRIAVGWDSRPGGEALEEAVVMGLSDCGARAVRLGILPTPTVGIAVRSLELAGGICITASHNPAEYNGLKFFSNSGVFVTREEGEKVFARADELSGMAAAPCEHAGEFERADAVEIHIKRVLGSRHVNADAIERAAPLVVLDCCNAAGAVILPDVLTRLGCRVELIYADAGAGFPRVAEPIPSSLTALGERVRELGASVGLACDPDADRLAIVDEAGTAVGEEYTLALAADAVLASEPGPVVTNVSTSRMIDDVAARYGAEVLRTAVGEANVVAKMAEVSAVVGGEGNGGVVMPDVHLGRDAAVAAAIVVSHMAGSGADGIGELVRALPSYVIVKRKLPASVAGGDTLEELLMERMPGGEVDRTDGVKILWADSWVHVRPSNTEPIVRVIAEAPDAERAENLATLAEEALADSGEGSG